MRLIKRSSRSTKQLISLMSAGLFFLANNAALAAGTGQPPVAGVTGAGLTVAAPIRLGASGSGVIDAATARAVQMQSLILNLGIGSVKSFGPNTLMVDSGNLAVAGTLVVPRGVTLIDQSTNLLLSGNLINRGKIYVVPGADGATSGGITASNITNGRGGLITSILPAGGIAGILGKPSIDLSLTALHDFINAGSITSSGALNIAAGGSITNTGSLQGASDVGVTFGTGSLTNSGSITSALGNLNINSSLVSNDLNVFNRNGILSAVNGAINFRGADYTGSANINVVGGDLLSQVVNFNSGIGVVNTAVGDVTGLVNVYAEGAHIGASTPNLQLGHLCTTGDPTYYNQGSGNSITLSSVSNTAGQDLAILAGGNITVNGGSLSTANLGGGNGGNLLLVAGANITSPTSGSGLPDAANTTVTMNGGSVSGGAIDLTGTTGVTTSGTTSGNAGSVQMIAFKGTGLGSGTITAPSTIDANGAGTGNNGAITLIAGATSGTAISTGALNTSGGAAGTGSITLAGATPIISGGGGTISVLNGAIQGGSGTFTTGALQTTDVSVGNMTIDKGNLEFQHGGTLTKGSVTGTINRYSETATDITYTGVSANTTNLNASRDVFLNTGITSPGGISVVAGRNIISNGFGIGLNADSATSNAGNITLAAGATFSQDGSGVTVTGGSATGGRLDLNASGNTVTTVSAKSTATDGAGGNITMVAFTGTDATGNITVPSTVTTSGNGAGSNGNLTMVGAGGVSVTGALNTSGGAVATGNVELDTATPNSPAVISKSNGGVSSGSFTGGSATSADVSTSGGMTVGGSSMSINSGRNATLSGTISGTSAGVDVRAAQDLFFNGAVSTKSIAGTAGRDISLGENLTAQSGIALVAGRDIRTAAVGKTISTSSTTGNAGNISLVAGAAYTQDASKITVTGASATGGYIDLNYFGNTLGSITANSTFTDGSAGSINITNFDGSDNNAFISSTSPIQAKGNGAGSNGNITVVGGRLNAGSSISLTGAVDSTGGASGTGRINVYGTIPASNVDISKSTGQQVGFFLGGALAAGDVTTGTLQDDGEIINLGSSGSITVGAINKGSGTVAPNVRIWAATDATQSGVVSANTYAMAAQRDAWLSNSITAPGGIAVAAGRNITANVFGATFSADSSTGNAGNITMASGVNIADVGTALVVAGPSTTGGHIDLNYFGNQTAALTAKSTFSGGNGGNITLASFLGSDSSAYINDAPSTAVSTSGNGTGSNGNLTVVAGGGMNMSGPTTTSGGVSGTGNVTYFDGQNSSDSVTISKSSGGITAGTFLGGTLGNNDITIGTITTDHATVDVTAGHNINFGSILGTSNVRASAGTNITLGSGSAWDAGSVALTAQTDVNLSRSISAPLGLTVVAGHDIYANNFGLNFNTDSASGDAGNITMAAGANFTQTAGNITISGASATGGHIDLNYGGNQTFNLTAKSTATNGNGGNITLFAYNGSGNSAYVQDASSTVVSTSGNGTGNNGNILVIGTTVTMPGATTTSGGTSGTGNVSYYDAMPNTSGNIVVNKSNATYSGTLTGGTAASGGITLGTIAVDHATITVDSGGSLTVGSIGGTAANLRANAGVNLIMGANISLNSVVLTAGTDIQLNHNITAPGGITAVAGHNIYANGFGLDFKTDSASTDAGNITMASGAAFTQDASNITITGASATGGYIDFNYFGNQTANLSARSTATNGNGGNITLFAYNGSGNSAYVQDASSTTVSTSGNGTGNNGNILVIGKNVTMPGATYISGGTSGTGNVSYYDAMPNTSGNIVVSKSDGTYTGTLTGGTAANGGISTGTISLDHGTITLNSAGNITIGTIGGTAPDLRANAGVNLTMGADIMVNSVALTAGTDIQLNHNITAPGGITLVAGHNIYANGFGLSFQADSATADAGNITMIAGAAFTQDASKITITGASATGGYVDLNYFGNATSSLTAHGYATDGNGGNITLIAFPGSDNNAYVQTASSTSIDTQGSGTGSNGNITAVGNTLNMFGTINTLGSSSGTGNITFFGGAPNTSSSVDVAKSNGAVTGTFLGGTAGTGNVSTGTIQTGLGTVTIDSGNNLSLGSFLGTSILKATAGNNVSFGSDITAQSVSILAKTDIPINHNISAPGGILLVAGHNIYTSNVGNFFNTQSATDAGDVTLVAGAAFTHDGSSVTVTGPSSTGGFIDLNYFGNTIAGFVASGQAGGSGGNITLATFNGSDNTGSIFVPSSAGMITSGTSGGNSGNFTAVAGTGGLTLGTSIDTTGGASGTGNITLEASTTQTPVVMSTGNPSITSGSFAGGTLVAGDVVLNNLTADAAAITIRTDRNVRVNNIDNIAMHGVADGGSVTVVAKGTSQMLVGTAAGANFIASIVMSSGTTSGNGGSISVTNNGTNGLYIAHVTPISVSDGSGAHYSYDAGNGTLTLDPSVSTLTADGVGTDKDGGSITLAGNTIGLSTPLTLSANATGSGTGGQISVTSRANDSSGDLTIGTFTGNISATANGTDGSITFTAGHNLSVNSGTTVSSDNVYLNSTNGTVTNNGTVIGNQLVSFDGALGVSSLGNIDTGDLHLTSASGSIFVSSSTNGTSVLNLTVNAPTNNATINNVGQLALQSSAVSGTLTVSTSPDANKNGSIVIAGNTSAQVINLTSSEDTAGTGGMTVANGAKLTAGTVNLSDNDAAGGISGDGTGDIGSSGSPILTVAQNVSANTKGSVYIQNTGSVTLLASTAGSATSTIDNVFSLVTVPSGGNGRLTVGGDVSVFANTGNGNTGTIQLIGSETSGGNGGIRWASGTLSAQYVDLRDTVLGFGSDNIGTSIAPIKTATPNLMANTNGGVYVLNSGAVSIQNSGAGSTFQVSSSGNIDMASDLSATTITLVSTNGNITIDSGATVNALGLLTLSTNAGLSSVTIQSGATAQGTNVLITTPNAINNGTVESGSVAGDTLQVTNVGDLTLSGSGTYVAPKGFSASATNNLNVTNLITDTQSLSLSAGNVLTLSSNSLSIGQDASGNGGTLSITANSISLPNPGPLSLNADGTGTGNGGNVFVNISSNSPLIIGNAAGNIQISARSGAAGGNGGLASVTSAGSVTVDGAFLQVDPRGTNGDGGTIALTGASIGSSLAGQPFTLTANGVGTGAGGTITYDSASTAPLTIGTAAGNLQLNASGASGGTITVHTGGNLIVNPAQINAAPTSANGDGAYIDLAAGSAGPGVVTLLGALNADGGANGNGGTISLQSNSAAVMTIGSAAGLSVAGVIPGDITIANTGGGITLGTPIIAVKDLTIASLGGNGSITISKPIGSAATGTIELRANGTGKITDAQVTTANNLHLFGGTGLTSATNVKVNNVSGFSAGAVTVTSTSTAPLNIGSLTGTVLTIKSPGDITTSAGISGTAVTLQSTSLTNGKIAAVGNISATTGALTLTAIGGISVTGNLTGATKVALTSSGAGSTISLDGDVRATAATGTVAITAAGVGATITAAAGTDLSSGGATTVSATKGTITLDTVGGAHAPTTFKATALNGITTNGSVSAMTGITETVSGASGLIQANGNMLTMSPTIGSIILTANGAGSNVNTGAAVDLSAFTAVTLSASTGHIHINSVGATTAPTSVKLTGGLGVRTDGDILAKSAITETSAGLGGIIDINGNLRTTSLTAGTITVTASNVGGVIDVAAGKDLSAFSKVALTATKGLLTAESIGQVKAPLTVALTARDGLVLNGPLTAVNSATIKTTSLVALSGNMAVNGNVSATGLTGAVSLTSAGTALITQAAGSTLSGKTVKVTAPGGMTLNGTSNGANGVTLLSSAGDITLGATSSLNSTAKAVSVTAKNNLHANGSISANTGVTLKTTFVSPATVLDVNDVATNSGIVSIIGNGASVNVLSGADITVGTNAVHAATGKIIIEDANKTNGAITIADANIATYVATPGVSGNGSVTFSIGLPPAAPVVGSTPSGVNFNPAPGATGPYYFGANGIVVNPGTVNMTSVGGGKIIFNALPGHPITITPGSGSTNITADPPVMLTAPRVASPATVSAIPSAINAPTHSAPQNAAANSGIVPVVRSVFETGTLSKPLAIITAPLAQTKLSMAPQTGSKQAPSVTEAENGDLVVDTDEDAGDSEMLVGEPLHAVGYQR